MRRLSALVFLVGVATPVLADDFALEGLTFQGPEASLTVDSMQFKNSSLTKEEAQKLFATSTSDDDKLVLWKKLKADEVSMPKLEALVKGGKVTFNNIVITQLADNKMGHLSVAGMSAELVSHEEKKDRAVNVRANSFNADNVDFTRFVEGAKTQDYGLIAPQMGYMTFAGGEITVEDDETPKDAVGGNLWRIRLASAEATTNYKDSVPVTSQATYNHLTLEPPPGSKAGKGLVALGYDKLDFSLKASAQYDAATRALTLSEFALREEKSGILTLKANIGSFDKTVFTGTRDSRLIAALNGDVSNLSLRFDDLGATNKTIGFLAQQQKQSVDEYKKKLSVMNSQIVPLFLGNNPAVTKLTESVNSFMASPKNITISFSAKGDPVKLTELLTIKDPQKLFTLFNVDATANVQ